MAVYKSDKPTKDGRSWYFRVYYTDLYGNRKQKEGAKFFTKKEAQEEERIFLVKASEQPITKKTTIKELKEDYLKYQKEKVRLSTYDSINVALKHISILEDVKIEELNLNHINKWRSYINSLNIKTGSKNNIYKRLRALLNFGKKVYDLNISIINKMTNFSNPNEIKSEMLFYTKEEFDKFISCEEDLKWICFFSTLFYCGLRQGEALALNWNDIDFENHTIKITKNLVNKLKGVNYVILPPKTKASIRTIPMPLSLSEKLKNRYNDLKKYKNFSNDWFVFGEILPLPTTTIQKRRDRLVALSGVKRIRIHDFRHSCASLLIKKGANITLVAKFLGHANIATTLNIYAHFYENDLVELISTIDAENDISIEIDSFLKSLLRRGYNIIEIKKIIIDSAKKLDCEKKLLEN